MKKTPFLALLTLCVSIATYAQNERISVYTNKPVQTIYDGYIANTCIDDKNRITYRILYTAFQKDFVYRGEAKYDITYRGDNIPPVWKAWAKKNNYLKFDGKEESLKLTNITFQGEPPREYFVMLDGTRHLRCYTISSGELWVNADSLVKVEKPLREPTLITGIDDVVTTERDTYTGIITLDYPGKQLQIWDKKSDKVNVVDYADIRSFRKEVMNPGYQIWEQSPYLWQITLKNSPRPLEGIIVEQTLAKESSAIKFATKGGIYSYMTKDILSIFKHPNPEYQPVYDIILEPGQTMINRDSLLQFVNVLSLVDSTRINYLDPQIIPDDTQSKGLFKKKDKNVRTKERNIVPVYSPEVVIETSNQDISNVFVVKATERQALLVPKKNPVKILTYKDEDLFYLYSSIIKVEKSVSINNTTRLAFKVPEEGVYFVYLMGLNKWWIFEYKKQVK